MTDDGSSGGDRSKEGHRVNLMCSVYCKIPMGSTTRVDPTDRMDPSRHSSDCIRKDSAEDRVTGVVHKVSKKGEKSYKISYNRKILNVIL